MFGLFRKNLCRGIRLLNSFMSVVSCLFHARELLHGMNFSPLFSSSVCVWFNGWSLRLTIAVFNGPVVYVRPLGAPIVKNPVCHQVLLFRFVRLC